MLTPVDIENKEFAKTFRGYDSIEVDEFMRTLVTDYEKLYRENGSLKEKNAVLSETLENYKGMETTMQNAILVAQKTAEDIKQNAYERSATIEREAEIKAKNIVSDAKQRATELEKECTHLKKEMNTFKARMNSLLQTYLKLLDDMPEDSDAVISDLERDIDEIRKQNSENAEAKGFTSSSFDSKKETEENKADIPEKKYVFSSSNENKKPYASAETKADAATEVKKEAKADETTDQKTDDNSYVAKKINPVVDELLKKRSEGINSPSDKTDVSKSSDTDKKNNNASNGTGSDVPEEIIIDLNSKNAKPFDVFSDDSL